MGSGSKVLGAMELFDTHCHLNLVEAFPDPDAAVQEAAEAGVTRLCVVGIDLETCRLALEIADRWPNVSAVIGWHPNSAASFSQDALHAIRDMLSHSKAAALGEIGLDFFRDHATHDQQYRCLAAQLDLAEELDKPVVFHCREANDELLEVLEQRPARPYLFHCFAGSSEQAARALALGSILGFDGPLTYKKGDALREILRALPEDRFVLETDSPFMPPEPFRGKPNKPSYLPHINAAAAACRGISQEACASLSTAAARRFFRI